jgi:hypothetical protein
MLRCAILQKFTNVSEKLATFIIKAIITLNKTELNVVPAQHNIPNDNHLIFTTMRT